MEQSRLASGVVWSIPITLPVTKEKASILQPGDEVKLVYGDEVYGVIEVADIYEPNKRKEALLVYGTEDLAHPGVQKLFDRPAIYVGGKITLIKRLTQKFPAYSFDPVETRQLFADKGWKTIVGFQTRNPVHRHMNIFKRQHLKRLMGYF